MRREGWIKDRGNGRIEGGGGVWRGVVDIGGIQERDLRGEGRKGGREAFEGVFNRTVKGSHQGF